MKDNVDCIINIKNSRDWKYVWATFINSTSEIWIFNYSTSIIKILYLTLFTQKYSTYILYIFVYLFFFYPYIIICIFYINVFFSTFLYQFLVCILLFICLFNISFDYFISIYFVLTSICFNLISITFKKRQN